MTRISKSIVAFLASTTILALTFGAPAASAASEKQDLRQRVEAMERMLQGLKQRLGESEKTAMQAQEKAVAAEKKANVAEKKANVAEKQANAEDNASVKWHLGGYANALYTATNQTGTQNKFGNVKFNPIFLISYKDRLLFEAEPEISVNSDATTKLELEYADLNLILTDYLTLTMGKFLSPVGQFQSRLHPTWINKMTDHPPGFVEDGGIVPLQDVGVMARGGFPVGSMTANYAAWVGNGPRLSDAGINLEGFGGDVNNDKAFGGRVGLHLLPYLEVGASGMHSRMNGIKPADGADVTDADFNLWGADVAFTKGSWDIRAEFIDARLGEMTSGFEAADADATLINRSTWRAWYGQVAYRLSGLTDNRILGNFEPVLRYGSYTVSSNVTGWKTLEERRLNVGLDYWFAPSAVAKVSYGHRDFENQANADELNLQFAYGF